MDGSVHHWTDEAHRIGVHETELPLASTSFQEITAISSCPDDVSRYRDHISEVLFNSLSVSEGGVMDLSMQLYRGRFIAGGSFGEVYQGLWKVGIGSLDLPFVAIKVMKAQQLRSPKAIAKREKKWTREIRVWKELSHSNLVPLLGIMYVFGNRNQPAIVLPWMSNGTLVEYLESYPDSNRKRFMLEIIDALHYLHFSFIRDVLHQSSTATDTAHSPTIIHGDLKAVNVLVDNRGRLYISDFGLSLMLEDSSLWNTSATHAPGSVRWMAPELLNAIVASVTKEADIYAFAMTCFEMWSGHVPFHGLRDGVAMMAVGVRNERPSRCQAPQACDRIWNLIQQCWVTEPSQRPLAETILRRLSLLDSPDNLSQPSVSFVKFRSMTIAGQINSVTTSPLCSNVAVVSRSNTLEVMDYISGSSLPLLSSTFHLSRAKYSPDGSNLAVVGPQNFQAWHFRSQHRYESIFGPGDPDPRPDQAPPGAASHWCDLAFVHPDYLSIPLPGNSRILSFGSTNSRQARKVSCIISDRMAGLAVSRCGQMLASISKTIRSTVIVHDSRNELQLHLKKDGLGPFVVTFSPAEDRLAVGYLDGSVVIWETVKFTKHYTAQLDGEYIRSIEYSRDGRMIATVSGDRNLAIIDTFTRETTTIPLFGGTAAISSVAFSFDGDYLIVGVDHGAENLHVLKRL